MTHPSPQNETTPATGTDGAPAKQHGDPLLNAAQRDEGPDGQQAQGTRHGHDLGDSERDHG